MSPLVRLIPILLVLLLVAPAAAQDAPAGMTWSPNLPAAMKQAKEDQKIVMVCVNAKRVAGRDKDEPAAKGLREKVYRDADVIEKSKEFVCVFLTPEGGVAAYGELRKLGVDGEIVSPQHIFIHPDGEKILLRREYWSHGSGQGGVKALLEMMATAQRKLTRERDPLAPADEGEAKKPDAPPEDPDGRAAWVRNMVAQVVTGSSKERDVAVEALIEYDQDGDCIGPLTELFKEEKKNFELIVYLVRTLGRDGLSEAALPICDLLNRKEIEIRGNAAVSLEYIGSREKKVVAALKKAAGREKEEGIANHIYRALGRCGVEDGGVRSLLLKKTEGAKSEFASFGPIIGLAYYEGDAKAARGVEKILKKIGVPGGRRGGGQNTIKRGLLAWTLASIADEKSGRFVREELMRPLENTKAFWVDPLLRFYDAVVKKCEGDDSAMAGIEAGVGRIAGFARGAGFGGSGGESQSMMDEYREDRDGKFRPKGDQIMGGGG